MKDQTLLRGQSVNREIYILVYEVSITTLYTWLMVKAKYGRSARVTIFFLDNSEWPQKRIKKYAASFLIRLGVFSPLSQFLASRHRFFQRTSDTLELDNNSLKMMAENSAVYFSSSVFVDNLHADLSRYYKLAQQGQADAVELLSACGDNPEFYVYNGRFCYVFAMTSLLKKNRAKVYTVERTNRLRLFNYYSSSECPWEIKSFVREAKEELSGCSDVQLKDICSFYDERMRGLDIDGRRYGQALGTSPQATQLQGNSYMYDITYYTASLDEFVGFGIDIQGVINHEKQTLDVLEEISALGRKVCIRIHPNTVHKAQADQNFWLDKARHLSGKGLEVISPTSKISSYSIMHSSHIIFTNGSTIGAESSYCGKRSYSLTKISLSYHAGLQPHIDIYSLTARQILCLIEAPESCVTPSMRDFALFAYLVSRRGLAPQSLIKQSLSSIASRALHG